MDCFEGKSENDGDSWSFSNTGFPWVSWQFSRRRISGTLVAAGGRYHMIDMQLFRSSSARPLPSVSGLSAGSFRELWIKNWVPMDSMDPHIAGDGFVAASFREAIPALAQDVRQRPPEAQLSAAHEFFKCAGWWTKCNLWRKPCKSISITLRVLPQAHLTRFQQYSKLVS